MKKKDYEKPTTQVVELQQQAHMLQASPLAGQNRVQDYNWNDVSEE